MRNTGEIRHGHRTKTIYYPSPLFFAFFCNAENHGGFVESRRVLIGLIKAKALSPDKKCKKEGGGWVVA